MAFYSRDWDEVRWYASEALRINPVQSYVHLILAYTRAAEEEVLGREGVEDVFRECRRAVALDPTDGGLWKSYGDLALRIYAGEVRGWADEKDRNLYRDETIHAYRQALRYDSGRPGEILRAPAEVHPDREFLPAVVRDLDVSVLTAAVALLLESGGWESDEDTWWSEASRSASPGEYHLAAAEALRRGKRHGEAYEVLARHLSSSPEDAEVMYRAAEEASALGQETWETANDLYLGALQREPESVVYRRGYGMSLARFGEPRDAFRQLVQVAAADTRDAHVHFTLGRMAEKMHDIEAAREHYRRAVSLKPRSGSYKAALEKALERKD
jgi:tetratricopeptide (TPR) repeat protein